METTGSNQPPSVVSALRAIIAAADQRPGGDTHLQEIPKGVICDARLALAAFDKEFLETAGRPRIGGR